MPRTAITLAKDHSGKWSLVSGPDVPLPTQLKAFRETRVSPAHAKVSEFLYQESDGFALSHKMLSADEHKRREEARKAELEAAQKIGEGQKKAEQEKEAKRIKANEDAHAADIRRLDNLTKTVMEIEPKTKTTASPKTK